MLTQQERDRILAVVAEIYGQGYSEGIALVVREYYVPGLAGKAALKMEKDLEVRMDLISESLNKYIERIEAHADAAAAKGLKGNALLADVIDYTKGLVFRHADIVAQTEYAKGRMDGATAIMDETGVEYEFRFPHFDIMTPGHEVCPICDAIQAGSPYSSEEAEMLGYPDVPHPNCDHGWVIVPKGEISRTEEHPQGPAEYPAHLL